MLPLPIEPAERRILKLSSHPSTCGLSHGSSERRQPTDAEGKNPHCELAGNFDEPTATVRKGAQDSAAWVTKTSPRKATIGSICPRLMQLLQDILNRFDQDYSYYLSARMLSDNLYQLGILNDLYQEVRAYCDEKGLMLLSDTTHILNMLIADNDTSFLFEKCGNYYKHLMIDEFQDINLIQWKIMCMLAAPENNLFVVGDDDQSIYRFRGSKPEIMLGFQKIYPQAKIVNLEVNYRCEPPIVEAAMRLIAHNEERFPKKIRAGKSGKQKVRFQYFEDCYKENAFLAEDIRQTVQNGVPLSEIAVLFRTNMQPRALMEYMVSANLAFQTKDRIPDIYEHWIARDFFTYIRIAQGSDSRADFLSIMNRPKRYIGRDSLPDETVCFDEWMKLYEEQPWIAERIEKLWYDLKHLSRLSPYAAINYIRRGIGYDDYLAEYAEYRNANKEDFYEVADEILASAKGYRTFEEWFAHIEEYRQELKRLAQEKRRNQNAVTFATLHSAKGLEFTKVYLIDVNEGIMPYKKAVLKQDVEEERRLFYVGMTRAKESLTICSVKKMRGKEVELSRFIKEAGKEP